MNDERPPGVLGGLPRTRPHRRSDKRAAASPPSPTDAVPELPTAAPAPAPKPRAAKASAAPHGRKTAGAAAKPRSQKTAGAAAKPRSQKAAGTEGPPRPPASTPPPPEAGPLGTAVQAAAELAEIGLMASARALRNALSRLPRR